MPRRDGTATVEELAAAQQAGGGPPPGPVPGSGPPPEAAAVAALIATTSAVASAGAAGAGPLAAAALAQAAANAAAGILAAFDRFLKIRLGIAQTEMGAVLIEERPGLTAADRAAIVVEETAREKQFAAKARERLATDLPPALALTDPAARADAVTRLLDRERRFTEQREQAMRERIIGRAHSSAIRAASPQGAYWRGGQACCDRCRAMSGKVWPWAVLDLYSPPLHPNCACSLWTIDEARHMGWIGPDDFATPDHLPSGDIMETVAPLLGLDVAELDRALLLLEAWDGRRHPRDRRGRWRENPLRLVQDEIRRAEQRPPLPADPKHPPAPTPPPTAQTFDTVGHAGDWAAGAFGDWTTSLTKRERASLRMYKDDTKARYRVVNDALRGRHVVNDFVRRHAPQIDGAVRRGRLPDAVVVHRVVPGALLGEQPLQQGAIVRDPGFMSASLLQSVAEEYASRRTDPVLLTITLPGGTPAGYLDDIGDATSDRELLLPAGALMRVDSVHEAEGVRTAQVTLEGFRAPELLGDPQ